MTPEDLERFVRAFIEKPKRDRWLTLLNSAKGRKKLTYSFHHSYEFDERWSTFVGDVHSAVEIASRLRKLGAGPTAYLLSSDWDLDGQTLPLDEALGEILNSDSGHYLICIPDRLAFFESEDRDERYVLHRAPPHLLPD